MFYKPFWKKAPDKRTDRRTRAGYFIEPYIVGPKTVQYEQSNNICDALRDLVPFVQFKKAEKHP